MADNHAAIPTRDQVASSDKWDLTKLFADDDSWEKSLAELQGLLPKIETFRGTIGESADSLKRCLDFMMTFGELEERLGTYASLRLSEDAGSGTNQERFARYMAVASKGEAVASYQTPEIQAIPDEAMKAYLATPELSEYRIYLEKILRFKPHVLSEREERLLALQIEANQTASKAFGALTDVDMDFGEIDTPQGRRPLSQSSFSSFLISPDRDLRAKAYHQFYDTFYSHRNTLAALYAGSVHLDVYHARVRDYPSARASSLFPDDVPESVYDNLISTVSSNLDALHAYYDLRKKALGLSELRHYDVYVPLVKDIQVRNTYEQAVELVIPALEPLGEEYGRVLEEGLLGGWVDRYENKGKRSGAFSMPSYTGNPHILLNYKDDVLRDVFTMAHEGGHSMHSYYSSASNPFPHYHYTIFEAEVASTFNEQLLADYLTRRAETKEMKAYLIGKQVDDIIATIYRQTMFAEFEHITHTMVESGRPLTVDSLRAEYRKLLEKYFGSAVQLEDHSDLEGLRIPHFYRAFYVYKYATGLSAAIALAKRVMQGGASERDSYLAFLHSGGSRYPIESLKLAGVDMSSAQPIQKALTTFAGLVEQLAGLL